MRLPVAPGRQPIRRARRCELRLQPVDGLQACLRRLALRIGGLRDERGCDDDGRYEEENAEATQESRWLSGPPMCSILGLPGRPSRAAFQAHGQAASVKG